VLFKEVSFDFNIYFRSNKGWKLHKKVSDFYNKKILYHTRFINLLDVIPESTSKFI